MTLVQTHGATSTPALPVLRELFDRLHADGIRYCHWKSNEHLGPSMIGATDVDILVDRQAAQRLTRVLTDSDRFKRFVVKPGHGYPGIEDYVGFDESTGALTHLHIHYQLTLGEKFIKGHRLPWEELYLSTRVLDEAHGIYVADPHLELTVLVARAAIKVRARDVVLETLGVPYLRGGLLRELRWLAQRVDPQRLRELASGLVGERAAGLLPGISTAPRPSIGQLRAFAAAAEPRLDEYRLFSRWDAARRMSAVEWSIVFWKVRHWLSGAATRSNRTVPQGGLFIAFVGADGAGKSTLTREIAHWLSREVAVTTTYGGSGKGSATGPRRVLQGIARVQRRVAGTSAQPVEGPARAESAPSRWRVVGRLLVVLTLARERRRRALDVRRARGRGMIVLADRLPQRQFAGLNDGPQLTQWVDGRPGLRRLAARRERAAFDLVERTPPDLVIKLHVSIDVARQRKPETPLAQLRTGIDVVRRLQFPPTTRVLDVDASQPYPHVLLLAKRAVWERI